MHVDSYKQTPKIHQRFTSLIWFPLFSRFFLGFLFYFFFVTFLLFFTGFKFLLAMRQRILKSFFVAVIQIMHGTFCHAGGKKPAKPAKPVSKRVVELL